MKLYDLIYESALRAIKMQNPDGSMPSGHNGPYNDEETPVRNTCHWVITFIFANKYKPCTQLDMAIEKCANYLMTENIRPMKANFLFRLNPHKDFANGLIGPAWVFEALAALSNYTKDDKYLNLARNIYKKHFFDNKYKLWRILNVDGSYNMIDGTFNHQLWFAAIATLLDDEEIHLNIVEFMDNIPNILKVTKNGRICHPISKRATNTPKVAFIKELASKLRTNKDDKSQAKVKEIGYHHFNLYAFCLLKNAMPDHSFFQTDTFKSILGYINSTEYLENIESNRFAYPYNPPGFECAYAIQTFPIYFSNGQEIINNWLKNQIKQCFDFELFLMAKRASDTNTCAARLYEATRLNNYEINV